MQTRSIPVAGKRRRSSVLGATTEQRLLRLQRKVNALDPELKCFQSTGTFTNVDDAAGQIIYLSAIAQGSDNVNRIGDRINIKSIELNFKLTGGNVQAGNALTLYGVYLIKDLASSGAIPVVSGTAQSIFVNPGPVQAMINTATKDRFKIMKKWVFGAGMIFNGNALNLHTFSVKGSGPTNYHDGTAAITGAGKNAYYLVVLSDDTADTVDLASFVEIRFTDA